MQNRHFGEVVLTMAEECTYSVCMYVRMFGDYPCIPTGSDANETVHVCVSVDVGVWMYGITGCGWRRSQGPTENRGIRLQKLCLGR